MLFIVKDTDKPAPEPDKPADPNKRAPAPDKTPR
jgi:hypothetical protein